MGRRTALIGLAAVIAMTLPASARQFFDDVTPKAPEEQSYDVGFPLEDLVREMATPAMEAIPGLPTGAVLEIQTGMGPQTTAEHLDRFSYDPISGRFSAIAVSRESGNFTVRGRAAISVPVMMPVRRIETGEIVQETDLIDVMMPVSSLTPYVLAETADIVGKEAKRTLMAERPIAAQSLTDPLTIKRGSPILISLNEGGLSLSAPGKSLQDGRVGETIRVVNTHSNKTLHALVLGDGHVRAITVSASQ